MISVYNSNPDFLLQELWKHAEAVGLKTSIAVSLNKKAYRHGTQHTCNTPPKAHLQKK
jgi:hypothetical protein